MYPTPYPIKILQLKVTNKISLTQGCTISIKLVFILEILPSLAPTQALTPMGAELALITIHPPTYAPTRPTDKYEVATIQYKSCLIK